MREPEKDKEEQKEKKKFLIYPGAVVASVLSIVQARGGLLPQIAGIAVYILAGVFLVTACIFLVQDLKNGVIEKIVSTITRNPLGEKFFDDYTFRIILSTMPTFIINVAYTVYNGVLGVMHQSEWFITMAVYYSLLGIMRYHAVHTGRKISRMEDQSLVKKKELSVIKTEGILLLLLNLALSGVVLLTIVQDTAKRYSEIMVITIAAYTFYKIITSVINMIKVRKLQSPILITIRNISVADALVSVLTLQMTMLASFQGRSTMNINQMNAMTGMAACILISLLGISMIYYSYKRNKKES
ncbi:hypothetical protein B5E53_13945 [Eubacterium sp. An11]|nr:hypothetical protein B5E53_13945 [Eubacterium sp. An11]